MEVLGIISGGDKLLVDVLVKVGMDKDDGFVLVILDQLQFLEKKSFLI